MAPRARFSRRRLIQLAGLLPLGALGVACGDDGEADGEAVAARPSTSTPLPEPTATVTPEPPFIVAEGDQTRLLMEGTPSETPIHVFGSGREGPIMAILGGVHGNEPGGWLAAERVRDSLRPENGALIVVPRANTLAVQQFVRTTDELGDLNRLYPGDPDGQPMAQMAFEITETLRQFHATHSLDLHESWAFFNDRTDTQTGTAFLGQTLSSSTAQGLALGRAIVAEVNGRILSPVEEMTLREWPPPRLRVSDANSARRPQRHFFPPQSLQSRALDAHTGAGGVIGGDGAAAGARAAHRCARGHRHGGDAAGRDVKPPIFHICGCPGSGKSTLAPLLAKRLPEYHVLDCDWLMDSLNELSGVDLFTHSESWPALGNVWFAIAGTNAAAGRSTAVTWRA